MVYLEILKKDKLKRSQVGSSGKPLYVVWETKTYYWGGQMMCKFGRRGRAKWPNGKYAIDISGGARVFAARGKRLCCRPRLSDQFCNQCIFRISDMGCKPTLGGPPLPSLPLPYHNPISHLFSSNPLEVGPLNSVRRSGQRCKLSQRYLGRSPGRNWIWTFGFKIWQLVATN